MSQLEQKLLGNAKVFTAEITPPKGAGIKKLVHHAELVRPHVDAINITDCQRALVKMSSLAACRVLLDNGVEPVFQLTCRDRNTIALQADLMGATALKIPNLLCLTGDPVKVGDSTQSKSVFEIESVQLLQVVGSLQKGLDAGGNKMNAPTKFFVGAVVNPTLAANSGQFVRMQRKVDAGARFFQTQANYDLEDFRNFLAQAKTLNTKVLAGILVIHTYEMAVFIHDNIPGIRIPSDVLERLKSAPDQEQAGIEFAVDTMLHLEDVCAGFHIMTVRYEELIPKVMERYHARRKTS